MTSLSSQWAEKATNNKKFIITVDTETFLINGELPPFDSNIDPVFPEGNFGVSRIMDICDKYGAKATFFVDVYMHYRYGEKKVEELCVKLHRRGHDVQLHVHAGFIPGCEKDAISSYSLEKQAKIIEEGKNLIYKWLGKMPSAFRAGSYAANLDTIKAIEMNGFRIDSSYFPFQKNCELSRQLNNSFRNRSFKLNHIFEIPVTTYLMINSPLFKKVSKLDINACSLAEFKNIIPKFIRSEIRHIVLFLHSFSFIRWNKGSGHASPDFRAVKKFEALLSYIVQLQGADFQTMDDISKTGEYEKEEAEDYTPSVNLIHLIPRLTNRFLS